MPQQALNIAGPEGTIDATLHTPGGSGPWPGVLMLADFRGPRPAFSEMANRLAGEGYAVLLPNVYYREGRAPVPDLNASMADPQTLNALFKLMGTLTPERMRADGKAEVEALLARPEVKKGPLGVVGYCMSGKFAIYTAATVGDRVAAVASYHGAGLITDDADSPHQVAARLKAALYFGHAENDDLVPAARLPNLEQALKDAGVDFTSEVYKGAAHGFSVPDAHSYNKAASERHWQTLLSLFRRTLK